MTDTHSDVPKGGVVIHLNRETYRHPSNGRDYSRTRAAIPKGFELLPAAGRYVLREGGHLILVPGPGKR